MREGVTFQAGQELLESDGIVASGVRVGKRTTLANLYVPENTAAGEVDLRPAHVNYTAHDPAIVDRVAVTQTYEEQYLLKLLLRQTRVPERGDKFSSRHGQKG